MTASAELGFCPPEVALGEGSNYWYRPEECVLTRMVNDVAQTIPDNPELSEYGVGSQVLANPFSTIGGELLQRTPELPWTQERLRPEITPLGLRGYFNPAVIEMSDGTITLLARHVEKAAEYGLPDAGSLVKITLKHDGARYQVLEKEQIWEPADSPDALLEDVRALNDPKGEDKRVFLGATVVMDNTVVDEYGNTKVEKTPFGAIAILDDESQISGAPKRFRPCPELGPGKNMTPLDMKGNFLFRKEGEDGDHNFILSIIHYDNSTDTVTETGELDFTEHMKDAEWGKWRIGTTTVMPSDDSTQTLILHGINTEPTDKNPYGAYLKYAFGLACLEKMEDGTLNIVGVDPKPMAVPEDFLNDGNDMEQLHPELRNAIYLCGQVRRTDKNGIIHLDQFPSYGDTEIVLGSYQVPVVKDRTVKILKFQKSNAVPKAA